MSIIYRTYYNSPIGLIEIETTEKAITKIQFVEIKKNYNKKLPDIALLCKESLEKYFKGTLKNFKLPIEFEIKNQTEYRIYNEILKIPYGKTTTYSELGKKIEKNANPFFNVYIGKIVAKNPVLIIIPCHRIIRKDNSLAGYRGGIERKKWLLEHEKSIFYGIKKLSLKFK